MRGILLLCTVYPILVSGQDYCDQVQRDGLTTCHECVEITILGGRPNCAYCSDPYPRMSYCQAPFYPPALAIPGLTVYACYNDSGVNGPLRYRPRCSASDCYIDQCLVSGKILWYYIVPGVIGGVILCVCLPLWCWCRRRSNEASRRWIEDEKRKETKAKGKLDAKARERRQDRETKTAALRKKYGLDDPDDEAVESQL